MQLAVNVYNLLKYMNIGLLESSPGVKIIKSLYMNEHITVRRKHLYQELATKTPRPQTHQPTYIMKVDLIKMPAPTVLKDKEYTPGKR